MLSLALTLALAAPSGATVAAPPPSPEVAPQAVDTGAQARALCESLTPPERLKRKGDVVAQARAEAEHEARRGVALDGRYRVAIPADRLRFAPYDPEEKRLALSERTFLAAAGGMLHLWLVDDPGLAVTADAAAAQRVVQAAARRTLTLLFTFTLPDDEDEASCAHPNGSAHYTLGVEPFAWEYVEAGQVLARGGAGGDLPLVTAAQGARPRVEVSDPVGEGGRELRRAVEARGKELEGCYQRALQQTPGLDGTMVAELDLSGGGAPHGVRLAADSVQDEAMAACVRGVLSRVDFPPGEGARAELPIHFLLEPPTAENR